MDAIFKKFSTLVFVVDTMSPPILKGSMVYVEPEVRSGRRNSEGGVGIVQRKKKRKTTSNENENLLTTTNSRKKRAIETISLSQDSEASGVSVYDI